ncbi:hypothetical protein [Rhodobacteraceae phage LS06-2018-MD07]|nr:hypothetical protein [Rhodobacteraceae phage LS06-2018-MD07]
MKWLSKEDWVQRREIYRSVFSTPEGSEVLADILNFLGYYDRDQPATPEAMVSINLAREILYRAGVTDHTDPGRMIAITKQLLSMQAAEYPLEDQDEEPDLFNQEGEVSYG